MKKLTLLLVLGFVAVTAFAQTKIGYADPDYVLEQMPESKQIETDLKTVQTQLKNQMDTKTAEFQKKLADYQANAATMLAPVRENTERELQQLQQNLEKFQQDAQTTVQNKHQLLMTPVYLKISKAIEAVAKENGYNLILSSNVSGFDVVLYGDDQSNVSDLVLKNLGITPKPAQATTATTPTTPANKPK